MRIQTQQLAYLKQKKEQMAQEKNILTQQVDNESTIIASQTFQKKTRPKKRSNLNGFQEDNRKKSKKKHWKPIQNFRYLGFLKRYGDLFQKDREDKRIMKINIMMSNFIKTKNSTQCRSHHQKMEVHYKSIAGIIAFFSQQFGINQIEQSVQTQYKNDSEAEMRPQEESLFLGEERIQQLDSDELVYQKECHNIDHYFSF